MADFFVHLGSLGGEVADFLHCSEWFVLRSSSLCLLGTRPSDAQPRPSDALQLSTHFFCCLFVLCSSQDSRSVTQNLSTCIHTYTYSVVSFRHGRTGIEPRVHVSLAQTSVVVFSPKGNKYISLITPNMIYDTKGAAWGRLVGHKDKRMQTFIAFWGLDSAFGQMRQLGMLSDDEIRVLSPSLTGAIKMSRPIVENAVVGVTRRWEQHFYSARLPPLQRCLMKAVLRIRWANAREFLIYDVAGLFRCLKWRILLGFCIKFCVSSRM